MKLLTSEQFEAMAREHTAIVVADEILEEWRRDDYATWDRGEDTWHTDPNWGAWFYLSIELCDRAMEWIKRYGNGSAATRLIERIADKYIIG